MPRAPEPAPRTAWIVSVLLHGAAVIALLAYAFWSPKPTVRVETFQLVSLEPPKLRPLAPKNPDPPPEKPRPEARAPEAPKLVPKPKNPAPVTKPEPKTVRPPSPDTALPVREVARENSNTNPVRVANAPVNPRMAFWAARVKRMIEQRWNPPAGVDVDGPAKTVVRFLVAVEDGTISRAEIAQSSGNKLLDEEALRAIKRQDRLIPPKTVVPPDFSEDFLQVSYEFIYQNP